VAAAPQADVSASTRPIAKAKAFRFVDISLLLEKNIRLAWLTPVLKNWDFRKFVILSSLGRLFVRFANVRTGFFAMTSPAFSKFPARHASAARSPARRWQFNLKQLLTWKA
jgi:hypothetical protein